MKRLIIAALVSLIPAQSLALEGIAAAERDLWCGLAIELVVGERPADSAIDPATLNQLVAGAEQLIARAEATYRDNGYSAARLAAHREKVAGRVSTELGTTERDEPFSYEDCRRLLD